jgi:hypothetical protein
MRAICKGHALTLLLKSELFGGVVIVFFFFIFEVPPLASSSFLTMLHPLLKNVNRVIR